MNSTDFALGDKVFYCGERHRNELGGKTGWVHGRVAGQPNTFIIEFSESKHCDSYVLSGELLTKWRPAKDKRTDGPEIQARRQKTEDHPDSPEDSE